LNILICSFFFTFFYLIYIYIYIILRLTFFPSLFLIFPNVHLWLSLSYNIKSIKSKSWSNEWTISFINRTWSSHLIYKRFKKQFDLVIWIVNVKKIVNFNLDYLIDIRSAFSDHQLEKKLVSIKTRMPFFFDYNKKLLFRS